MKQGYFILWFALSALTVSSQDYLIGFTGSGETTTVDSVRVMNLTQETSLSMMGSDTLHIMNVVGMDNSSPGIVEGLQISPNPFQGEGLIQFETAKPGLAEIVCYDNAGRVVLKSFQQVAEGSNAVLIRGLNIGIYLLTVKTPEQLLKGKLVSTGQGGHPAIVDYSGTLGGKDKSSPKNTSELIPMQYNEGDQLLFIGYGGPYSTVIPLIPTGSLTIKVNFIACVDQEGHHYATVGIGPQVWMAQNLNTGVRIDGIINQTDNGVFEKYCFDNDESNCSVYGGLYQWNEMMQYDTAGGAQGLCPDGWHLPTDGNYSDLMTLLGGDTLAGGRMKETGIGHWAYPNGFATNSSGFTALPGGFRFHFGGFSSLHGFAFFWSSTQQTDPNVAWYRDIPNEWGYVYRDGYHKNSGLSVRCIKD